MGDGGATTCVEDPFLLMVTWSALMLFGGLATDTGGLGVFTALVRSPAFGVESCGLPSIYDLKSLYGIEDAGVLAPAPLLDEVPCLALCLRICLLASFWSRNI